MYVCTAKVCFFSATLHSPQIHELSRRVCVNPTWVDLKGVYVCTFLRQSRFSYSEFIVLLYVHLLVSSYNCVYIHTYIQITYVHTYTYDRVRESPRGSASRSV